MEGMIGNLLQDARLREEYIRRYMARYGVSREEAEASFDRILGLLVPA